MLGLGKSRGKKVELFDVENIVTLKPGLDVTQGHLNRYHSKA